MNALSSTLEQTAIENSYNALSEAYREGLISPAVVIANSAFESYIEHQLLQEDDIESVYGGERNPDFAFWGDSLSNMPNGDSYCSRLQEAENREIITDEEHDLMYDTLRIRDQIAHNSAWFTHTPLESDETISEAHWQEGQEDSVDCTIEDVIAQYEDIITPEAEETITDQERGNWEQEYLQNNHRSAEENIVQLSSQASREQPGHPLNAAAGVIAYNFLEDEVPARIEEDTGLRPEHEWQEDCLQYWAELDGAEEVLLETERNSSYEAISGFENFRNLFAHNIEAYSGLPNQYIGELLHYGTETALHLQ